MATKKSKSITLTVKQQEKLKEEIKKLREELERSIGRETTIRKYWNEEEEKRKLLEIQLQTRRQHEQVELDVALRAVNDENRFLRKLVTLISVPGDKLRQVEEIKREAIEEMRNPKNF